MKTINGEINITSPRLVAVNKANQPITEEYKKLKSTVIRRIKGKRLSRRILVTSALNGKKKSITSLNLAVSLALNHGVSVTLMDANLRNPSICRYLGLDRPPGLSDYLADGVDLDTLILKTGMGNLTLLPAGHRVDSPVELFTSPRMQQALDRIAALVPGGYVVFDTPPILPFAEPRILSTLIDSAILVVKEGGTTLKNLSAAAECLSATNILGVVYNKANFSSLPGGYQYYYYDYANRAKKAKQADEKQGIFSGLANKLMRKK